MRETAGLVLALVPALAVAGLLSVLGNDRGPTLENAIAAFEARDFDQAVQQFTGVIDSGGLDTEKRAQALAYRGYARLRRGESEAAAKDLSLALELNPDNGNLRHALVAALVGAGELRGALAEADRTVEQNPSDRLAHGNRCDIRRRLGEFDMALADCNRTVELAPEFAYSWAERAKLYRDWGRDDEARSDIRIAYQLWPDHPSIRELAEYYGLGPD